MKQNLGEQPSGKLGNVVFYQRYGKSYVRAAPKKRETYTEEQLLYRQRMSRAGALWRSLRSEEIARIWNLAAEGMNNYAWFIKANLPALAMDGTLIDPGLIRVSDGPLPLPQDLKMEPLPGDQSAVKVSWQNDANSNAERRKDQLQALTYANGNFSGVIATGLKRSDLQGTFTLPARPAGVSHVFLWMAAADGEGYSPSLAMEL